MRTKIEVPKILQPVPVDGKICAIPIIILSIPIICNISYGVRPKSSEFSESSESLKIYNQAISTANITSNIPNASQLD